MPEKNPDEADVTTASDWPPGYAWGDDPRTDWELLNVVDEATRTQRRQEFLRTGAPWPSPPAALTRDDVPAVLAAAVAGIDTLWPLVEVDSEYSMDAGPAGDEHPGKIEILFSAKPAHREELLRRLRKGLATAGYDAWPHDVPELVGSGTLSILVSRSASAQRRRQFEELSAELRADAAAFDRETAGFDVSRPDGEAS